MVWEIKIKKSENRLYLYFNKKIVKIFDVCLGKKETPTPIGEFFVIEKIKYPWLKKKNGTKIPGGRKNPLGSRLLILANKKGDKIKEGIHGCYPDFKEAKNISNGCVRMHNKDINFLFRKIPLKTKVKIFK